MGLAHGLWSEQWSERGVDKVRLPVVGITFHLLTIVVRHDIHVYLLDLGRPTGFQESQKMVNARSESCGV